MGTNWTQLDPIQPTQATVGALTGLPTSAAGVSPKSGGVQPPISSNPTKCINKQSNSQSITKLYVKEVLIYELTLTEGIETTNHLENRRIQLESKEIGRCNFPLVSRACYARWRDGTGTSVGTAGVDGESRRRCGPDRRRRADSVPVSATRRTATEREREMDGGDWRSSTASPIGEQSRRSGRTRERDGDGRRPGAAGRTTD
ncbi:unnamed protein product [Cuscuta campestris]|uniref:Uncharacterized protein n=1 Tax=Cuscuta campestris TaxID=132261 RepID=A0A484K8I1_9ASTE|nr:unnamed protein product [Cuscuta campestris]